jgi:hypothetical protein
MAPLSYSGFSPILSMSIRSSVMSITSTFMSNPGNATSSSESEDYSSDSMITSDPDPKDYGLYKRAGYLVGLSNGFSV